MDQALIDAAMTVLTVWGLEPFQEHFVADGESLALLALLCNQAAKLADARGDQAVAQQLYAAKPILLRAALQSPGLVWWAAPHTWGRGTIALFVELPPPVGQIAFHLQGDEPELADLFAAVPTADGRRWDGLPKQSRAGELARAWLAQRTSDNPSEAPD
jgi:hypothetical protein